MIQEPGRDYFDEFQTAHDAAAMWRSGITAALGVGEEVTLSECRILIDRLRACPTPGAMWSVVLALAACFSQDTARETLESAAWLRPWALRVPPAAGMSPITRARLTVEAFLSPVDGWGEREGLAALLAWVSAPDVVGGPIIPLRCEISEALATMG